MKRYFKNKKAVVVVVVVHNCQVKRKTVNDRNPKERDITKGLKWLRKMS